MGYVYITNYDKLITNGEKMIAKKEWFKRRKYGGWGADVKTWQGWAYLGIMFLILFAFHIMPQWSDTTRTYFTLLWLTFLLIDMIPIMMKVKKDELEHKIEAIAERNSAWFMALVLCFGLLYDVYNSALNETILINWFIVVALLGGAIVKSISNYKLERKEL